MPRAPHKLVIISSTFLVNAVTDVISNLVVPVIVPLSSYLGISNLDIALIPLAILVKISEIPFTALITFLDLLPLNSSLLLSYALPRASDNEVTIIPTLSDTNLKSSSFNCLYPAIEPSSL